MIFVIEALPGATTLTPCKLSPNWRNQAPAPVTVYVRLIVNWFVPDTLQVVFRGVNTTLRVLVALTRFIATPIFAGLISAATPELPVRSKSVNVFAPNEQPPAAIRALTLVGTPVQTPSAKLGDDSATTPAARRSAFVILPIILFFIVLIPPRTSPCPYTNSGPECYISTRYLNTITRRLLPVKV